MQESLRREHLQEKLELKSSDREEQVQRAFATALDMQQRTEAEATALKAELARTTRNNQEEMHALTEQVRRCGYVLPTE